MSKFEDTALWATSLGSDEKDGFAAARQRLSTAYRSFWERGLKIASCISTDFPELTLHDEAHLNALWARSSLLFGAENKLNPLEAFIYGGAILLHDAGHAMITFPGGRIEIENSSIYKDALVSELRKKSKSDIVTNQEISNPDKQSRKAALFYAVRKAHAKQAEQIVMQEFNGEYLVSDKELRESVGPIIGKIAASHNWSRDQIVLKLPKVQGPPGFLPQDWSYSPIKLALLLRCADAIQIDQTRVPAFALAIHDPQGLSRLHWLAQRLAQPHISVERKIVFTSLQDFKEADADAWWIAYDLIKTADRELQGCSDILRDLKLEQFKADRVEGANDPSKLHEFIRTEGWRPIDAEFRVTDVKRLIELFGGRQLYGSSLKVPLRELIQNSADAIKVRKCYAQEDGFRGKIVISVRKAGNDILLSVKDNGLGMSESVLSGPLLEFGKSFWSSNAAQEELPGLLGFNLSLIGKFGIGFYSTLMLSDRIVVRTKRYDANYDEARQLTIRKGLTGRPLVSRIDGKDLKGFSTEVEVCIDEDRLRRLLSFNTSRHREQKVELCLKQLLTILCAGLETDVFFEDLPGEHGAAHESNWAESDAEAYLRSVCAADLRKDPDFDATIKLATPLLSVLKSSQGQILGRACVNFSAYHAGIELVGGLASARAAEDIMAQSNGFIGTLEFLTDGPRRDASGLVDHKQIAKWASDQAVKFKDSGLSDAEKYIAAVNICKFGGNPSPVAHILLRRKFVSLQEIVEMLCSGDELLVPIENKTDNIVRIAGIHHSVNDFMKIGISANEIEFLHAVIEPWNPLSVFDDVYHKLDFGAGECDHSFISCLRSELASRGKNLVYTFEESVAVGVYRGLSSEREGLIKDAKLQADVYRLTDDQTREAQA